MKRILLALGLLLIGANAFASTRYIRTYSPYDRFHNPYYNPYYFEHGYYNNWGNYAGYRNYNRYYRNYYREPQYCSYEYCNPNCCNSESTNSKEETYTSPIKHYETVLKKDLRNLNNSLNNLDKSKGFVPIAYNPNKMTGEERLSIVEKNVYGQSFEHQDIGLRLNRLEKSMFNKTYPSLSSEQRIDNLFVNYNREVNSSYDACYGGYHPKANKTPIWRKTLNNFGMMFGGYPTGMSPMISDFDDYMSDDGGISKSYADNYGWCYSNTRRGTGSSVKILD